MGNRLTASMLAVAEHPATPWTRYVVGLSAFGVSLYQMVRDPVGEKWHIIGHAALMLVGVIILPGCAEPLFDGCKKGLGLYQAWKSPTGGVAAEAQCPHCHKPMSLCICADPVA